VTVEPTAPQDGSLGTTQHALVADADHGARQAASNTLRQQGHRVVAVGHGREALEALRAHDFDLVVCDVDLPRAGGRSLLSWVQQETPKADVVLVTARGALPEAVQAVKDGATDFLLKPLDQELLAHGVARIAERRALEQQLAQARLAIASGLAGPAMIGRSPAMERLIQRVERIARSEASVLVRGESGTGKELVARLICDRSPRANGPFVAVNCAAFPETLLEAELFGHERGAFTGAAKRRKGRFQAADRGTLFLDEVAELPPAAQAKLLRVLQEGVVEPLGSDEAIKVDVRIISATHRDLKARIAQGQFREDLYYRLKVLEVTIPPLRERPGDLPLLVEHFLRRFALTDPLPAVTRRAWDALLGYGFPGNVRELEHAIQHAAVLCDAEIDLTHLPAEIAGEDDSGLDDAHGFPTLAEALRDAERAHLVRALELASGRRRQAAELLGISRKNLWEKLKAQGMLEYLRGHGDDPPAD
jgi:DNA-binding NtrC family response regulator